MLSEVDKQLLLKIARESIDAYLSNRPRPEYYVTSPDLLNPQGAFVTLHNHGDLRGCIGNMEAGEPLYRVVEDCAVHAATLDPRFAPVTKGELEDIDIEISVLSPLTRVESIEEIEVGRHGLVIEGNRRLGLLLPQVAGERGWSRKQFLEAICYKAGLPKDSWQDSSRYKLYTFMAEVFGEKETPSS